MNSELGIGNGGTCHSCLKRGALPFVHHSSFAVPRSRWGFTLIELLVVMAMIALITGALTTSVAAAMQRARIQKATADVKMLTQAIQSYANYNKGELEETKGDNGWEQADFKNQATLSKFNGSDANVPVLIQAALSSGNIMRDPWGQPYYVKIKAGTIPQPNLGDFKTGYFLPNFYRLTEEERQ